MLNLIRKYFCQLHQLNIRLKEKLQFLEKKACPFIKKTKEPSSLALSACAIVTRMDTILGPIAVDALSTFHLIQKSNSADMLQSIFDPPELIQAQAPMLELNAFDCFSDFGMRNVKLSRKETCQVLKLKSLIYGIFLNLC